MVATLEKDDMLHKPKSKAISPDMLEILYERFNVNVEELTADQFKELYALERERVAKENGLRIATEDEVKAASEELKHSLGI